MRASCLALDIDACSGTILRRVQRMISSRGAALSSVWLSCVVAVCSGQQPIAGEAGSELEIRSITVDGQTMALRPGKDLSFPTFPGTAVFDFGVKSNAEQGAIRIQCRLEGYEEQWRSGSGEMFLAIRSTPSRRSICPNSHPSITRLILGSSMKT